MRIFGNIADLLLEAGHVLEHGTSLIQDVAVGRLDQSHDDLYRRRLTRTVRAEIAGHRSRRGGEADSVDRGNGAKVLLEIANFEHGGDLTLLWIDTAARLWFPCESGTAFRP